MIKIIEITTELIEDIFQTGYEIKSAIIEKGISKNDFLINVKLDKDRKILELWFSEVHEFKNIDVVISTNK
ncbi:MAG: hypothetical protein WAX79_01780 [Candidatus Omnitrophota bacterium]